MKNDALLRLVGRLNAMEFVIGLLLDSVPQAQRQLAQIDLGKLADLQLAHPQSDAASAGFRELIAQLQQRHPVQR
ncbi:MAG: hypothetical protein ACKOF9_04400 [Burkholderiales bacterium]